MSHYDTLGVPKDSDQATIKNAYRRKSRAAHPDRRGGDHGAMVALNRAYETLSDPEKRAQYDKTGEDGPRKPSIEDRARTILMQLFAQCFELPDQADMVAIIRSSIQEAQKNGSKMLEKSAHQITNLEKKRKRIKFRGKGRNILADLIEQRIGELRGKIADIEEAKKISGRALEILEEYEWQSDQVAAGAGAFIFMTAAGPP